MARVMNMHVPCLQVSGALQCQAGCVLGELNEHLATAGYVMPLDLGPKDKCQIGGNVSTNAGKPWVQPPVTA